MAAARGEKRGSGGQGSRRRAGRSGGPLRQDRARAPLRRTQLGGGEHPRDLGQASTLAGLLRYPSRMGKLVRLFEGRFGRLLLMEFAPEDPRPFALLREPVTPRIRRLAETLAVEVLNDRFLSAERLEFMLQELVLLIVETYLAKRRAAALLWRGSRFEDSRIRQAIALLRARPNKDLNMDELANRVGLSRSRFYDLFQLCTGFSPRAYLDMLCVETAISRLSSGDDKISEVSAELGFSAQSNFTRFFLNQVGVPPSEYRRSARGNEPPPDDSSS